MQELVKLEQGGQEHPSLAHNRGGTRGGEEGAESAAHNWGGTWGWEEEEESDTECDDFWAGEDAITQLLEGGRWIEGPTRPKGGLPLH